MIISILRRTFGVLPAERKRSSVTVLGFGVGTAIIDVVGVGSVMPFLAIASSPDRIRTTPIFRIVYDTLGFSSDNRFLIFLGSLSIMLLLGGGIMRTISAFKTNSFIHMSRYALSSQLLETYLSQPYAFFLKRNSAEMSKEIYNEANVAVSQVLAPGIQMFVHGVTVALMVGLLLIVDPLITMISVTVLGFAYWSVYRIVRNRSVTIGKARSLASQARFEAADSALGGAKTIKVMGLEQTFLARFRKAARAEESYLAQNATISQVPRNAIEAVALGGVLLIILTMLVRSNQDDPTTLAAILPQLGLFALAGYRVIPGLQAIYQAMSIIRFAGNGLDRFFADMALSNQEMASFRADPERLLLTDRFEMSEVSYRYDETSTAGLNSVSLIIPRGSRVGIIGTTGAGKTTLVDLMLGLLTPDTGRIMVGGVAIEASNRSAWQANIGYVPQDIYLLDASVAENIAISAGYAPIDIARVKECVRLACLANFVDNDLADGLQTGVGQRGVRLSGGQRQRIGIARALYRDPELIVFDEATSALDTATEQEVMTAINNLDSGKTIVLIAHRLSTIRDCDMIVLLEAGRVKATGRFEELVERGLIHDL